MLKSSVLRVVSGNFTLDQQGLVTYAATENLSYWYRLDGTQLAQFEGEFWSFVPEQQKLLTYSEADDTFQLSDFDGTQLATFERAISGLLPLDATRGIDLLRGQRYLTALQL
jgi:hypothetical protein